MKNPYVGQIVLYVPEQGSIENWNQAEIVPAIVVKSIIDNDPKLVNLRVFTDGKYTTYQEVVPYSIQKLPRTWHFIPQES